MMSRLPLLLQVRRAVLGSLLLGLLGGAGWAGEPTAVPTFHCLSIYWKPDKPVPAGAACRVEFREASAPTWREALPLWFDAAEHPEVPERSREFRGSILNLRPATTYEIRLRFGAAPVTRELRATTWSEKFKVKERRTLPAGVTPEPLVITEGGSAAAGYVVYEAAPGAGTTIDVANAAERAVEILASHVILRGVVIRGPRAHGIVLGDVTDVVIEDCDISGWGTNKRDGAGRYGQNYHAAIFSRSQQLARVVVQRCRLHHPRSSANPWGARGDPDVLANGHPQGPQGIVFAESAGNHVLRYNEIYSDEEHGFNDGMGAWENRGFAGFPNRDSDIYGNRITNVWDDAIEAEGADMNVRIWSNHVDHTFQALGLASTSLGPLYVFRNVSGLSRRDPPVANQPRGPYPYGGGLFKLGAPERYAGFAQGKVYLLHNTIGQPGHAGERAGAMHGILVTGVQLVLGNVTSRNNILDVRAPAGAAVKDPPHNTTNDYDYDLVSGEVLAAPGQEPHAIHASPRYETAPALPPGAAPLAEGSPGQGVAAPLPTVNDFAGPPDIGAAQRGAPPLSFGIKADWNPWVAPRP